MERDALLRLWNEHHEKNTWLTAWSASVSGLTPEQAAWKPDPQRHSIWQIVHHVIFWREYYMSRKRGEGTLAKEEVDRRNWEEPTEVGAANWTAAIERFNASHAAIAAYIEEGSDLEGPMYVLTHDCYHVGQIMQLRAMQGLKSIE